MRRIAHRVESKRARKAPPLPKEVERTGPRKYRDWRQMEYTVVFDGTRGQYLFELSAKCRES